MDSGLTACWRNVDLEAGKSRQVQVQARGYVAASLLPGPGPWKKESELEAASVLNRRLSGECVYFHLIVQPTAGVSVTAGSAPASTASMASRK